MRIINKPTLFLSPIPGDQTIEPISGVEILGALRDRLSTATRIGEYHWLIKYVRWADLDV